MESDTSQLLFLSEIRFKLDKKTIVLGLELSKSRKGLLSLSCEKSQWQGLRSDRCWLNRNRT